MPRKHMEHLTPLNFLPPVVTRNALEFHKNGRKEADMVDKTGGLLPTSFRIIQLPVRH